MARIRPKSSANEESGFVGGAFKRAEEVFAQNLWREQLRDRDEKHKPSSIATHKVLQGINPDTLSDIELAAYLTRCRDHYAAMIA